MAQGAFGGDAIGVQQPGRDDDKVGWGGQSGGGGGDAGGVGEIETGGARQPGDPRKAGIGVEVVGKGSADAAGGADDDGMGAEGEAGKQGLGLIFCSPPGTGGVGGGIISMKSDA